MYFFRDLGDKLAQARPGLKPPAWNLVALHFSPLSQRAGKRRARRAQAEMVKRLQSPPLVSEDLVLFDPHVRARATAACLHCPPHRRANLRAPCLVLARPARRSASTSWRRC